MHPAFAALVAMLVFWGALLIVRVAIGDSVIDPLMAAIAGVWVGLMVFRAMRRRKT